MRPQIWNEFSRREKHSAFDPAGSARATRLRLEMCYPLNGSDLSPEHNPLEAGLGFFVDLKKPKFIGRENCCASKENGPSRRLVPFRMKGKGPPPRPHYSVFRDGERIGEVTSGTLSPSLNYGIGMAYLPTPHRRPAPRSKLKFAGRNFPR